MIELFSSDTPNGKKIGIMLEEINLEYKVTKIDLSKGEQFKPEFRKISPFSKIPVIIDHDEEKKVVFEKPLNLFLQLTNFLKQTPELKT